jgi:hypothetical protein
MELPNCAASALGDIFWWALPSHGEVDRDARLTRLSANFLRRYPRGHDQQLSSSVNAQED